MRENDETLSAEGAKVAYFLLYVDLILLYENITKFVMSQRQKKGMKEIRRIHRRRKRDL
jgi:hypothetical protein